MREIAVPLQRILLSMETKNVIAIAAVGAGLLLYKSKRDAEYRDLTKSFDKERELFLEEIAQKNSIINPNGDEDQPPVSIVGAVTMGGLTLNQLEIILTIKNYSQLKVELGDWRGVLTVGGVESLRVIPSNLAKITIPAGGTVDFRLYARGDSAFPGVYDQVKAGLGIEKLTSKLHIPIYKIPASLDLMALWYWKGGKSETKFFDVSCSFDWPYAGWTVGKYSGYNAGKKNQQKSNPSYWEKYDEQ